MGRMVPWAVVVYTGVLVGWAACYLGTFQGWTRLVASPAPALVAGGVAALLAGVFALLRQRAAARGGDAWAAVIPLTPLLLLAGIPLAPLLGKTWRYPGTWEWYTWDYYALTGIAAAALGGTVVATAAMLAGRPRAVVRPRRPALALGAALGATHGLALVAALALPERGWVPEGEGEADVVPLGEPAPWITAGEEAEPVWAEPPSAVTGQRYGTSGFRLERTGTVTVDLGALPAGAATTLELYLADAEPDQPRTALAPLGLWRRDTCGADVRVRYRDDAGTIVGLERASHELSQERRWRLEVPAAAASGRAEIEVDPGVGCAALLYRVWAGTPQLRPRRVVLISLDTHAARHMSFGGRDVGYDTSPALNRLVSEDPRAVGFTRAIAAADWTLPTHATAFTGLYPTQHGMVLHSPVVAFDPALQTLPEIVRRETGAKTLSLVSHMRLGAPFGFGRGVDHLAYYEEPLGVRGRRVVEDALTLLAQHRDDDLLLFVHLFDAHSPYTNVPQGYEARPGAPAAYPGHIYDSDLYHRVIVAQGGRDPRQREANRTKYQYRIQPHMAPARAAYQLGLRDVDDMVGALIGGLKEQGLYEDTTILVFADHGEEFFDHGLLTHTSLYLENLEVPLVVKLPRGSPHEPLASEGEPFRDVPFEAHTTVFRVVLEAFGLPVPDAVAAAGTGGLGLEQLLTLQRAPLAVSELYDAPNSTLYQVSAVHGQDHAIVTTYLDDPGRWQRKDEFEEAYDAEADPREWHNLVGVKEGAPAQFLPNDAQQRAQELRAVSYESQRQRELTEQEKEMLRALGYLE